MVDKKLTPAQRFVKKFSVKKYLIPDDPHSEWETWAVEKNK